MLLVEIWKYYSKVYEATCTRQRIQRIPSAAIFKQGLENSNLDPASLFETGCLLPTAFQIQILEPDCCLPLARECYTNYYTRVTTSNYEGKKISIHHQSIP